MTAADLLNALGVFNNELNLAAGESDEDRGLKALDMAQSLFEAVAGAEARVLSTARDDEVETTANTETSDWPSDLLRLDGAWLLDPVSGLPVWEVTNIYKAGGQASAASSVWPLSLVSPTSVPGAPRRFYPDESKFWWQPIPDGTYPIRVYGCWRGNNLTDRSVVFSYPDECEIPIASVAARLIAKSVDDPTDELAEMSKEWFKPIIKRLRNKVRARPEPREYRYFHTT